MAKMEKRFTFEVQKPPYVSGGVRHPSEMVTASEQGPNMEAARRSCAQRYFVGIDAVRPVLDEKGEPVFVEYAPIVGAFGKARGSKYDRDLE